MRTVELKSPLLTLSCARPAEVADRNRNCIETLLYCHKGYLIEHKTSRSCSSAVISAFMTLAYQPPSLLPLPLPAGKPSALPPAAAPFHLQTPAVGLVFQSEEQQEQHRGQGRQVNRDLQDKHISIPCSAAWEAGINIKAEFSAFSELSVNVTRTALS